MPNLEPPFVTEDDLFREVPGMRHGVRSLAPPTVHSISSPSELDDTAPLSSDVRSEEPLAHAGKLMHSATDRPSLARPDAQRFQQSSKLERKYLQDLTEHPLRILQQASRCR